MSKSNKTGKKKQNRGNVVYKNTRKKGIKINQQEREKKMFEKKTSKIGRKWGKHTRGGEKRTEQNRNKTENDKR